MSNLLFMILGMIIGGLLVFLLAGVYGYYKQAQEKDKTDESNISN